MIPREGTFPLMGLLHAIPDEVVLGIEMPLRARRKSRMPALGRSHLVVSQELYCRLFS